MARIRTIKPEFWTSEQVAECSPNARLLFIGLWTFSDDNGVHPASTARAKMEVFPADGFSRGDVAGLIQELLDAGLLVEYQIEGEAYWRITGWHHQRIDQPTYKHPLPDGTLPPNVRRKFIERSAPERNVEEGKKKKPASQRNSHDAELFPGVSEKVIRDFKAHRKEKKASITETAMKGIRREADKAGLSLESALALICERGWISLRAEWLSPQGCNGPAASPRQREQL